MAQLEITLDKMKTELAEPVRYAMETVQGERIDMNALLGKKINMQFLGRITCSACGRLSNKSFNQGFCYPCFKSLARCDMCIMKPETCHFALGTCREPDWGRQHCMQPHFVYLANSSGLKVGITRQNQLPTRWIDQGAIQALPLYKVSSRYQAGLVEVCLGQELKDKTNWQAMLKGQVDLLDLKTISKQVQERFASEVETIGRRFGEGSYQTLDEDVLHLQYPVLNYPNKIVSYNLDKQNDFEDTLQGIKGQYLIFNNGVINIRKFSAYQIHLAH